MRDEEKVNILLVDDLPEKLLVLETVLEGLGQNLVLARSGREALRRLLEREYAVILLDVNMPDMDGFETAAMIRNRRQTAQTPIIFITAYSDEMHTAQGYSLGAVDFILSPVVPEILRTKVGVFVDLYRKTQQVMRQAEERVALAREQAARAAAEEASRRSAFLAEASTVLLKSLDYDATPRSLARVSIPFLGDLAAVTLLDRGSASTRTELAWIDPESGESRQGSIEGELRSTIGEAIRRVLATAATELYAEIPPMAPNEAESPESVLTLGGIDRLNSALIVPLQARGRVFGALTIAIARERPARRHPDTPLVEDLAGRAAIAIDNARLYRDIQQDDRRKNEFLAMLAHELRNPLAPIRNAVEILRRPDPEGAERDWAGDVIGRQVAQMVRLVDDLLDVSRITGGKIQLRKEPVDVAQILSHVLEACGPLIAARRQHLVESRPDSPLFVEVDKARLIQVLSNVLNNAAKYTGEGGEIRLDVRREGGEAVFRVRDSGIGIPAEMLASVFDLFTQVDRALDRSQGGLGIGLTLVRRLVEMHGGSVQAFSEGTGKGSEFVVRIPAILRPPAVEPPRPANVNGHAVQAHRILIVDDNEDAAKSLARLLTHVGHEVVARFDGPSALALASTFQPDFVFLDIGLPGMDGYEVARNLTLQAPPREMVLIALTGYGQSDDRRRAKDAGFHHHLVKPVEFDSLLAILSSPLTSANPQPSS